PSSLRRRLESSPLRAWRAAFCLDPDLRRDDNVLKSRHLRSARFFRESRVNRCVRDFSPDSSARTPERRMRVSHSPDGRGRKPGSRVKSKRRLRHIWALGGTTRHARVGPTREGGTAHRSATRTKHPAWSVRRKPAVALASAWRLAHFPLPYAADAREPNLQHGRHRYPMSDPNAQIPAGAPLESPHALQLQRGF